MENYVFGGANGLEWNLWNILAGKPNEFSGTELIYVDYGDGSLYLDEVQVYVKTGLGFGIFKKC